MACISIYVHLIGCHRVICRRFVDCKFVLDFFSLLFTVNVIIVSMITLITFAVGYLTYKKGLDPDNFVIPIESSLADSITTGALFFALLVIGYTI